MKAHFTLFRTARNQAKYQIETDRLRGKKECVFCNFKGDIVIEGHNFYVAVNQFPYDFWDRALVENHYMIIPYQHVCNFQDLPPEVANEYFSFLQSFEKQGFDVFTRSNHSSIKSQPHLHTHLIKTYGK